MRDASNWIGGQASSEEVSFVGTVPSIHLRPDASKGATGCESLAHPIVRLWKAFRSWRTLARQQALEEALAERAIENAKRDAEWNYWFPPN